MSKVIFKLSFKHPNFKDSKSKNMSHINYISTRSGVDKSITEADLRKELEKDGEADNELYSRYISERPKSHGLFDKDGIADPRETREELSKADSYVWRAIVSLREEDATQLGFSEKEKWQDLLRKKMPDVAKDMNIKLTNLHWVAAVHMEKGHPHAHIMFWEKKPERTLGVTSKEAVNKIRKTLTDEVCEEERFQLLMGKNSTRDYILELAKTDASRAVKLERELKEIENELYGRSPDIKPTLAPRLDIQDERVLLNKLKQVSDIMPKQGRVALKFMPEQVKNEVQAITKELLKKPSLGSYLAQNLKAVEEMTKLYTSNESAVQRSKDNAIKDVEERVSQIVLKAAKETQSKNIFYINPELATKAINVIRNIDNPVNVAHERNEVFGKVGVLLFKTGHSDNQILKVFRDIASKEGFNYTDKTLKTLIGCIKKPNLASQEFISKKLEAHLSAFKLLGYSENEALKLYERINKSDNQKENEELTKKIKAFMDKGIYDTLNTDYYSIRKYNNVTDITNKSLKTLSTALLVTGTPLEETKDILQNWNVTSKTNLEASEIDKIIEKASKAIEENHLWGKTTIISPDDWKEAFDTLGIDPPKWFYKSEDWEKSIKSSSLVSNIWKGIWQQLEQDRKKIEAQAEELKQNITKQDAISKSKSAQIEEAKKRKSRDLWDEEDFDR